MSSCAAHLSDHLCSTSPDATKGPAHGAHATDAVFFGHLAGGEGPQLLG